jgi:hypothetical protein
VTNTSRTGYTTACPPLVTFTGGAGTGATAHAVVNSATSISIVVDTVGSGYTSNPTVNISSHNGTAASGLTAVLGGSNIYMQGGTSGTTKAITGAVAGTEFSPVSEIMTSGIVSVTNVVRTSGTIVTVTALTPHGYSTGESITLAGITNGSACATNLNGKSGAVQAAGLTTTAFQLNITTTAFSGCGYASATASGPGNDLLFYGWGLAGTSGNIESLDVTAGNLLATATTLTTGANANGGTSGIVIDNVSTQAQAASIYFTTLAATTVTNVVNIASVTSPGSFGINTATVTTQTAHGFPNGSNVTIVGVTCTAFGCPNYNGTWTIAVTGSTTFTYTVCSLCFGGTANPNTGTASGPTTSFGAVKVTQTGLQ